MEGTGRWKRIPDILRSSGIRYPARRLLKSAASAILGSTARGTSWATAPDRRDIEMISSRFSSENLTVLWSKRRCGHWPRYTFSRTDRSDIPRRMAISLGLMNSAFACDSDTEPTLSHDGHLFVRHAFYAGGTFTGNKDQIAACFRVVGVVGSRVSWRVN